MRAFKQNLCRNLLFAAAIMGIAPAAWAAPSVAENFDTCRVEAELLYGSNGEPARVRLDDMRRSGKELRLRVVTPAGDSFTAVCEVNRRTGELVSLDPRAVDSPERRLSALDD